MVFPDNIAELINLSQEQEDRLIDVMVYNSEQQKADSNLESWTVEAIDAEGFEIKLTFVDPLKVSQGYKLDTIVA